MLTRVKPVELMVLLQNILFMLMNAFMLFYLFYLHVIVFIFHGYLPSEFMKTAIVLVIKKKTGDTSGKNNYRPIALVTACSKKI